MVKDVIECQQHSVLLLICKKGTVLIGGTGRFFDNIIIIEKAIAFSLFLAYNKYERAILIRRLALVISYEITVSLVGELTPKC